MPPKKKATRSAGDDFGRYRLDRLLGQGAAGEVWLALDEGEHGFRKQVALKVMTRQPNTQRVEAFMREARIVALMKHPNIIDVYGVGQHEGCPYIVMEYVGGETLSALWRDLEFIGVTFPRSVIVDIGIAVAEALHHAWTTRDPDGRPLRIVHRDLKPANVMVSDVGEVKVGDFGIAKAAEGLEESDTTNVGRLKGTPSYLAPEMWEGSRDFRPAIDLFSLGVILWELATGRRFFGKVTIPRIYEILQERLPGDEVEELRECFPELAPVVGKLVQRAPDFRPQSAFEVAEQLRGIKAQLGPAGDLQQFIRLVRAGRLEPDDRHGSLMNIPVLPTGLQDWEPLVSVASGDSPDPLSGMPPSPALKDEQHVRIGEGADAAGATATGLGTAPGKQIVPGLVEKQRPGTQKSLPPVPVPDLQDETADHVRDATPSAAGLPVWVWVAAVLLAFLAGAAAVYGFAQG